MIISTNLMFKAFCEASLIASGAQHCRYIGGRVSKDVWGLIEKRTSIVGADLGSVNADIWTIAFLDEQVTDPHRGDKMIDEDGTTWLLHEQMESLNSYTSLWSIVHE